MRHSFVELGEPHGAASSFCLPKVAHITITMTKNIFQTYLERMSRTGKTNPNAAFDLGRDAQLRAIVSLLIKKGLVSEKEVDGEMEQAFSKIVDMIEKMPPLPPNRA
jgi:hypothetical protein